MKVFTTVTADGRTDHRFGRAHMAAVAEVGDGVITDWAVFEVGWDISHDQLAHGAHHAQVVRFFREHEVAAVVAMEMGPGMYRMLTTMGMPILRAREGDAQASVLAAVAEANH